MTPSAQEMWIRFLSFVTNAKDIDIASSILYQMVRHRQTLSTMGCPRFLFLQPPPSKAYVFRSPIPATVVMPPTPSVSVWRFESSSVDRNCDESDCMLLKSASIKFCRVLCWHFSEWNCSVFLYELTTSSYEREFRRRNGCISSNVGILIGVYCFSFQSAAWFARVFFRDFLTNFHLSTWFFEF